VHPVSLQSVTGLRWDQPCRQLSARGCFSLQQQQQQERVCLLLQVPKG
jgi:hypothetical protein